VLDMQRRARELEHLIAVNRSLRSCAAAASSASADRIARSRILVVATCSILGRSEPGRVGAEPVAEALATLGRLRAIRTRFGRDHDGRAAIDEVLDAATAATRTDLGNIQLLNPRTGALEIVAHRGFGSEFLDFFAEVHDEGAACGAAMRARRRVIVEDVATHPIFAGRPAGGVLLRAGVRAVQSTPLVTPSGELVGMLSTHFRRPQCVPAHRLLLVDLIGRQTAGLLGNVS
jgi:hypothetical protein